MDYLWLKWVHILSATLLFGTGLGSAFFKWHADRQDDIRAQAAVMRTVVLADWIFTVPAILVQPLTGVWMARLAGYPLARGWVLWAILLYLLAGACWVPVVWLQIKMRALAEAAAHSGMPLPGQYRRYQRIWFALGVPAFSGLLVVFYLMVFKPASL